MLDVNALFNKRIDLHEKLSVNDKTLVVNIINDLQQDHSTENFIRLSVQIPMDRMDIGAIITYAYGYLNKTEQPYPLVLESLREYDSRLKHFSNADIALLQQALSCLSSQNEADSWDALQQASQQIPGEREDLKAMVYMLYWSQLFDGSLMFFPKKKW